MEIKFRVFDKISNKMHNWEVVKKIPLSDFELDHYEVMLYSGLTDINGVEIYQGDNLKDERSHGDYSDDIAEVRFVDGKFCYPNYGTLSDLSEINEYSEVIGNIHE